ncbi:MAG: AMP-binding protein [Actinomycetota bacterium]
MLPAAAGPHTIPHLLGRNERERGHEPFLIFEDSAGGVITRTYAETLDAARRTAGLFAAMGIDAGDRVHVHVANCPEFYDCWFGAALIGAILVPTNPLLTEGELAFVVRHARCSLSVTQPEHAPAVRSAQTPERLLLTDELAAGLSVDTPTHPEPLDGAAILYTSGTTSRPKGVVVTHANYVHAGEVVAQHLRLQPGDRWLVVLPLFHANAQYYSTMSALVAGSSVALMERFSASNWGRQAHDHHATVASLFAAPIRMILSHPETRLDHDNALRAVIFSQNVGENELSEFERRFGAPLLQLYGMTETIAPPTLNPLYGERKNMSIGLPTLPARVRVVGANDREVEPGEIGELLVRGEPGLTLMAGYLDDPDATGSAIVDGWLHTGDNVRWGTDGYLYFVDRAGDMIKRAGENVAAREVESVLNDHPDIFDSAVIGVPDPVRDEAIKAFVVLRPDSSVSERDVIDWCGQRLAAFKVPESVEVVAELPRTSVGKIQKGVLRSRQRNEA